MITVTGEHVVPGGGVSPSLYAIGWALARTGRFQNHTEDWYSVLPHTFVVADLVAPEYRIHALLHDAAESVIGDRVATWKDQHTKDLELEILVQLYEDLNLEWDPHKWGDQVLIADLAARAAEAQVLKHPTPDLFVHDPLLHEKAVELTTLYHEQYNFVRCLGSTHEIALEYQYRVQEAITLLELNQNAID